MNCVSASEAETFADIYGGRLPTEAEREFLATNRGQNQAYPWGKKDGKDIPPSCQFAVMYEGGPGRGTGFTMPVCSKPAGNVKLAGGEVCDLAGEVWEWTADSYAGYQKGFQKNPKITTGSDRVMRGGSFSSGDAGFLRADYRNCVDPGYRIDFVGFRPVRSSGR